MQSEFEQAKEQLYAILEGKSAAERQAVLTLLLALTAER